MNVLLERILNIIGNDAFPDEDKPYIIREVVTAWNESSEQVQGANETWYDEKYLKERKEIAFNQGYQKNALEHWDNGYLKGVSDAEAKLAPKHAAELHDTRNAGYKSGHIDGLEQGRAEADELIAKHAAKVEEAFYKGQEKGREIGYEEAKEEYDAKVLELACKHKQELQAEWSEGYRSGLGEGRAGNYGTAWNRGYAVGKTEGYKEGRKAGANEVVNTINRINKGLDT